MTDVRNLLGVYFSDLDLECEWKVAEPETIPTMGTTWAGKFPSPTSCFFPRSVS